MAADTRTADEIEREIERERSDLTETIETLQDRFSAESVVRAVGQEFREHGSEIGQSVSQSVKDNPMALALTGIGLAWMIFGDNGRRAGSTTSAGGAGYPPPAPAEAARPVWLSSSQQPDDDRSDNGPGHMARAGEAMRSTGGSVADQANRFRERLSAGTESLSEDARSRVVEARERAYRARASADRQVRRGAATAQDFYQEQPLIAGALALAVGTAIGGSLPRTSTEDAAFGRQSDDLIADAERIFRDEMDKAGGVARATANEARSIVAEKREQADAAAPGQRTAGEAARDEAATAGKRLAETARTEAEARDLGKPG